MGPADLAGVTDIKRRSARTNLAALGGGGEQSADNVIVNATRGDDVVVLNGQNGDAAIWVLQAAISVSGAEPSNDRVTINALAGDDVVDASVVEATSAQLTLNGGDGDDVEIRSAAAEPLAKSSPGRRWLAGHASTVDGETVLDLGARTVTLPQAQLGQL